MDGEKLRIARRTKDKTTAKPFRDESLKDLKRLLFYSARIPKIRVKRVLPGLFWAITCATLLL